MSREKGFDSKWVAVESKKETWQEVKTTGSKKKTLSSAEKKAKSQKISEQILKNADAVHVSINFEPVQQLDSD